MGHGPRDIADYDVVVQLPGLAQTLEECHPPCCYYMSMSGKILYMRADATCTWCRRMQMTDVIFVTPSCDPIFVAWERANMRATKSLAFAEREASS